MKTERLVFGPPEVVALEVALENCDYQRAAAWDTVRTMINLCEVGYGQEASKVGRAALDAYLSPDVSR